MIELSEVDKGHELTSIDPDLIILRAPVEISFTGNSIEIKNLWTFFSFKRLSKKILGQIQKRSGVLVRQFLNEVGYKDVDVEVDVKIGNRTSTITINFKEDVLDKKMVANLIKHMFSLMCFEVPEYSIREYKLMPISEDKYNFFIVLVPYKRSARLFNVLDKLLKYPYITLPDEYGVYYSSEFGEENINEPPSILNMTLAPANFKTQQHLAKFSMPLAETRGETTPEVLLQLGTNRLELLRFLSETSSHLEQLITQAIKDIANIVDRFSDLKPICRLLQLLHKTLHSGKLIKDDVAMVIDTIEELMGSEIRLDGLRTLLNHFQMIYNNFLLAEKLEEISIMRAMLRKIEKTFRGGRSKADLRGIPALWHEFMIVGSIITKCRKRIVNLGSGKAIYISPHEWKFLSDELGIPDNAKAEIKVIKRPDGKKCIVVDFLAD